MINTNKNNNKEIKISYVYRIIYDNNNYILIFYTVHKNSIIILGFIICNNTEVNQKNNLPLIKNWENNIFYYKMVNKK